MSKLRDRSHRHDAFHRKAKQQGFAARSVFKLEEIDHKHKLIRPGAQVLDLGCRPGSWMQYCVRAGAARVIGVDREPLEVAIPRTEVAIGDVFELDPASYLRGGVRFDVVLSDMAPDTTGIRSVDQARSEALFERALEIAEQVLAPGGCFLGKLFQGPDWQRLIKRARAGFATVHTLKPAGSRKESIEQYVLALKRVTS